MAWSYGADFSKHLDVVRSLIRDTDSADAKFQDEEIAWHLAQTSNVYQVAARLLRLMATFRPRGQTGVSSIAGGGATTSYGSEDYLTLAESYERRAQTLQAVHIGGISLDGKKAEREDPDRVAPHVRVGMHDFDQQVEELTRKELS